ncbi:MAG TPA: DUF4920 domain-containing protein [Pyrinomonadaceae bacterium]|nr:DUF4920 domain-containing protein [Pyrinomonadaceae bacterium]
MKKIFLIAGLIFSFSFAAFAQEATSGNDEKGGTNEQNAPVNLKSGATITRGAAFVKGTKKADLDKALKSPDKFAGKTVAVKGVIVRSCKMEGCWMEMAAKEGGKSVRVTFGDHAFFIPLNAAGMKVRAQGSFKTKTLTKEHVDHLINEDGAKFENRNADGTVTEVSFDATGVELTKAG